MGIHIFSLAGLRYTCVITLGILAVIAPAKAGDKFDQDYARSAVQSGQAMSYASVQERLMQQCDCRILEAKLHDEKDHGYRYLVYDIKAIRPDGQIIKIEMNALSGEILHMKNKGRKD